MSEWIPLHDLNGLEIGPLDKPLVQKALYKVRYADAFPAEVLVDRTFHYVMAVKALIARIS